jgi:hypothetical protein
VAEAAGIAFSWVYSYFLKNAFGRRNKVPQLKQLKSLAGINLIRFGRRGEYLLEASQLQIVDVEEMIAPQKKRGRIYLKKKKKKRGRRNAAFPAPSAVSFTATRVSSAGALDNKSPPRHEAWMARVYIQAPWRRFLLMRRLKEKVASLQGRHPVLE